MGLACATSWCHGRLEFEDELKEETVKERRAPVQADPGSWLPPRRRPPGAKPAGTVAWWEHEKAWHAYAKRYSGQSAETLARRGGFGYEEITGWLGHEPTTWEAGR